MISFLGRWPDFTKSAKILSVTVDLTQLHVIGALVALGAMTTIGLGKTRRSDSILTREKILNYSRWRLNEGPNDIRMTVQTIFKLLQVSTAVQKLFGSFI